MKPLLMTFVLLSVCFFPTMVRAADVTTAKLLDEMIDFDRLARMPEPAYRTYQFSSYDRQAAMPEGPNWFGNSDGFGGEPIPAVVRTLTKANDQGVGTYVIAEMNGPGAIVRCWTAAGDRKPIGMNGRIRLYLDDAEKPVFEGEAYDFLNNLYPSIAKQRGMSAKGLTAGLAQRDAGYYPVAFAKSCRVEWTGNLRAVHFYHIEMRKYAPGTTVETFQPEMLDTHREKIKAVGAVLANPAAELTPGMSETAQSETSKWTLAPGETRELLKRDAPGKITWLQVELKAKNLNRALRQNVLEITFDGHSRPQVESPLGDFFGAAPGINPYDSLPMQVIADGTMVCRFVMPFARSVRCTLTNRSNEPVAVSAAFRVEPHAWDDARDMHFYARWRVNHNMQITGRRPFDIPFLCARGQGRFVGCSVHLMNPATVPGINWWGEGDEKIFVDDDGNAPSFFGTGSEDYFNYSWGQYDLFHHAYFAQPRCDGPATRGFVVNNRWHILDDIPFYHRIDFSIEMLHHLTIDELDYARISYYYGRPGIFSDHMPLFAEDLREPTSPENWEPTAEGTQTGAIYFQCEELDGAAGLIDADPRLSRGKRVLFTPKKDGDRTSLAFDAPKDGKYRFGVVMNMTPRAGRCDVWLNGRPLPGLARKDGRGQVDLYTPFHTIAQSFGSAPVALKAGKNTLTFVSRGKNQASRGTDLGVDFFWIQP
ncbi:MAG TPA: glycoside hydrolase family 172 protein [Thermoguttaceae bacterium]|nr:glycoside hydrolase family 172 protein [Thermoguttaceae bacterium]